MYLHCMHIDSFHNLNSDPFESSEPTAILAFAEEVISNKDTKINTPTLLMNTLQYAVPILKR